MSTLEIDCESDVALLELPAADPTPTRGFADRDVPLDLVIEALETVKAQAFLLPLSCCEDSGNCESCSDCSSCDAILQ